MRGRRGAARARRPRPHPSPLPRAVGGETRAKEKQDNAGPGWRLRALSGSPASSSPGAASCRTKFAPQPCLPSRGSEAVTADLPPPRRGRRRLPPRGAAPASPRGRGARERNGAREGEGTREEAARARGEPGARRSPRTRCRSGGFSVEAGAAPRLSVRYESWPGRRSLPAILARLPLDSHQKGSERGPATSSPARAVAASRRASRRLPVGWKRK